MATQNEKIARKALVVQEVLKQLIDYDWLVGYSSTEETSQEDAKNLQLELIKRGYLIVSL